MNKESNCSLTTKGVWVGWLIGVFGAVVTLVWLFVGALSSDPDPTSGTLVQRVYEEIPDEAAKWLLTVSAALEEEKAARSQESGLQALREKTLVLPDVSEAEVDGR